MVPAQQRLGADDAAGREADLRLPQQLELAAGQRARRSASSCKASRAAWSIAGSKKL
jgi:hypothetical protein